MMICVIGCLKITDGPGAVTGAAIRIISIFQKIWDIKRAVKGRLPVAGQPKEKDLYMGVNTHGE